jgi:hypothetical protein
LYENYPLGSDTQRNTLFGNSSWVLDRIDELVIQVGI